MAWGSVRSGFRRKFLKRRHSVVNPVSTTSTIYEDSAVEWGPGDDVDRRATSLDRKEFSKEFTKNPDVIVHASSTSRLFEMLNSKTCKSDRKIGLGVSTNGGCRSLNDIMTELNSSLASLDSAGHSEDNSSLFEGSSCTTGGSMTESMAELAAEDMITALRTQRAHLLERRAEMQMRVISLENEEAAILTGQRVQQVAGVEWSRKHVNTGFSISTPSEGISSMDEVSQLEFDVEIQKKIVHAARRLAREHGIGRSAKRERKMATQRALLKLQELERKLQSAKRFQKPAACNGEQGESEKQKLHEHQTYYKAVTDNGYYPHFRKSRTTSSSNSDDKVSLESDMMEADAGPLSPVFHDNIAPTRNSSSSSPCSLGNSQENCVRASLQMTLAGDTKTLPRKRADTKSTLTPQNSSEPPSPSSSITSPGSASKEKSFFSPWPIKIESLTSRCQDNLNISKDRKYEQYRPRAGTYTPADNTIHTTRYDNNVISDNMIHSYDKYLHTLRLNRQRNGTTEHQNRNYETKRHSVDQFYDNKSCNGHLNISAVSNNHSTVV